MSIFGRLFKIGQAGANKAVDSLEKPELMLEQAIRDQDKTIAGAKRSVQNVIATERQTKAMLDQEKENARLWEQKAEMALKAGNEELAAKALTRSEEHGQKANTLNPQWEAQRAEVEKLKTSIRKMEDELAELKRNKDIIIAQSKSAEVKKQIYQAKAKMSTKGTSDLVERMRAKAQRASYEAEAAEELSESSGDSLEKEFEQIGATSTSSSVQSKLEAMKAKMQSS
jgi:phage shock protein A